MEMLLVLIVIGLPALALGGFIVGLVAMSRTKALRKKLDDVADPDPIGPGHPLARRLRALEQRVHLLESAPRVEATALEDQDTDPGFEIPIPVEQSRPVVPDVPAEPPAPHEDQPTFPHPPEVLDPTPQPVTYAASTSSPAPPEDPPAPRPRIEWERWIGVRGAAAAGGIVLALAALLFFQYSIEHGLISPTMRVVFGIIVGIGCLVGSEWLVKRDQAAAANALAGAGIVTLYGATWAAQNLYGLIGTIPAFVLMVLITGVCVTLAVSRDARFIAVLGLLGGFATPLLVASDVDSAAALFGYILLLDLGLLWLARARGWPLLAVLSLGGTALHQAIWIFGAMDAERAAIGIVVLAVFGLAFLFVGSGEREPSRLWRATRAGGVAIPFAFALHFATSTQLAENPWPLGLLLIILSAGACWLSRRETRGPALTAAGASLGVMALWFLNHRLTPSLAWQAVALIVGITAVFTIAAELSRKHPSAGRLGVAALGSMLGFMLLLALAPLEGRVVAPWPWIVGWIVLGAGLVFHSRWPNRSWAQLAAGLGPAFGIFVAVGSHWRGDGALEPWTFFAVMIGTAVVFQILAVALRNDGRLIWAERTAAATALALMPAASLLSALDRSAAELSLAAVLVLGLLGALCATRAASGAWLLAATASAAFWQSVVFVDAHPHPQVGEGLGPEFAVLSISAVLFTIWPALVPGPFKESRSGWWAAALAGPFWFMVLKSAFVAVFGEGAVGLLPVALAGIALATVLTVRPRLAAGTATRRTALVWYLAVALSLVSIAIPLQLEKEWITIGWALNGLAILLLWVRLNHPGLKYFGLALLGAATIRLVANPEVLDYHIRAGIPVANWLTYTYLVPALALILSHRILKSKETDRLTSWEKRLYPQERPLGAALAGLAAVFVVFAWINLAIADLFATGPNLQLSFERLPARDATTSVAWALYALILLAIGVRSKSGSLRWLSLGLLVLTIGKVFLHDLGELEDLYRVGSLVGLALSLIIVSLIYQRFVFRAGEDS